MFYRERSDDRGEGDEETPRFKTSPVEVVHHALFRREAVLTQEYPGSRVEREFQDSEPRAILWLVGADGAVLTKEFLETAFSADVSGRDEEYLDAARRYGRIALHYPGVFVPREYVIRRVADLWVKLKDQNMQEEVTIRGFLYDDNGRTVLEV